MSEYQQWIQQWVRLMEQGQGLPFGRSAPLPRPDIPSNAPCALIFSPHPDDEVIIGGLPLRLMREANVRVINIAVTQGSNRTRQAERLEELKNCCDCIGFELVQTASNGLEKINAKTRDSDPDHWQAAVARIAKVLSECQPQIIFFPHATDRNSTHIGTHLLVLDALEGLGPSFECSIVETEFWEPMPNPNLLVESSQGDLADLITALSFHVGEVKRNPYHLRMPAWMMDNVRRGAEQVGAQGGGMPDFLFGTLYRLRSWKNGQFEEVLEKGEFISQSDNPRRFLPRPA